jgi:hypothetical protein
MKKPTKFSANDRVHAVNPETGTVHQAIGTVVEVTTQTFWPLNWVRWDDDPVVAWWRDNELVKVES